MYTGTEWDLYRDEGYINQTYANDLADFHHDMGEAFTVGITAAMGGFEADLAAGLLPEVEVTLQPAARAAAEATKGGSTGFI